MPLDRPFRDRFEGYFNERRSPAPKFTTSSRNTLLAPYQFGGGFGTEPKAPHNIATTDVGPVACDKQRPHTPRAVFGSAKREELWRVADMHTPPCVAQVMTPRARTPNRSRNDSFQSAKSQPASPPGPQSYNPKRSDFDTPKSSIETRTLIAKFSREGVHTPKPYAASASRGGAIPRSARTKPSGEGSPGPAAYRPKYGLL